MKQISEDFWLCCSSLVQQQTSNKYLLSCLKYLLNICCRCPRPPTSPRMMLRGSFSPTLRCDNICISLNKVWLSSCSYNFVYGLLCLIVHLNIVYQNFLYSQTKIWFSAFARNFVIWIHLFDCSISILFPIRPGARFHGPPGPVTNHHRHHHHNNFVYFWSNLSSRLSWLRIIWW